MRKIRIPLDQRPPADWLAEAQAACESDWGLVHHHLWAAMEILPRTRAQEIAIEASLWPIAETLAVTEAQHAGYRPDLADDPQLPGPHPEDLRRGMIGQYHPGLFPSLLNHAVALGFFHVLCEARELHAQVAQGVAA